MENIMRNQLAIRFSNELRMLLSRNFCERIVRTQCTVWKNEKFSLTKKIFRQINSLSSDFFSKNITFTKFLEKMCETNSQQFSHCAVWKNEKFSLTEKQFRQITYLFSNFFRKTNAFTKFLLKKSEREILQFPHCAVWNDKKFTLTEKIFREINPLAENNGFPKVLPKKGKSKIPTVWYKRKFTLTLFWQKFRESNNFANEITK